MVKGRRNKVLKLTPAKVKYIIRAKTNNISSRIIAAEMKVSIRTVNRVWEHWMKNKEPLAPKKFGRPKTNLNDADTRLILKIHKKQNSGARRLEKIIEHKYGRHIPHNAIHQVLLENGLAIENKKRRNAGSPGSDTNENTASRQFILIGTRAGSMAKRSVWSSTIVRGLFWQAENSPRQLVKLASTW
jgi:transposase